MKPTHNNFLGIKRSYARRPASLEHDLSMIGDAVHCQEAAGDLAPAFHLVFENKRPVRNWGFSYVFVEKRAERAETLEANLEANVGDRQGARGEQLLRSLYASIGQVLMRSLVERPSEEPEKMKPREAGFTRDLIEIERKMKAFVYESPCTGQPPVRVSRDLLFTRDLALVFHRNLFGL